MARKRNAGEGSIFERADGRWCAQLDLGWQNGRRVRKYTYGATAQEVQDALLKARSDLAAGLPVKVERQTVAQFLQAWLENSVKPSVRPLTHEQYSQHVKLYLAPLLGHTGSPSSRRNTSGRSSTKNSPMASVRERSICLL